MIENKPTLIFTGGHHTSSLAVAKQLNSTGWQIIWFGHRHSMWGDKADSAEYKDVVASGFTFFDLRAGKIYHTYNPLKLIRLPYGFLQAFYLLIRLKLKLNSNLKGLVSFGGYLAVPTVICGWLLNIPSITHEQTVVRGWANHLLSPFVKKIALTWPSSQKYYPPQKTVLTGLPLRPELFRILPRKSSFPVLYITGGKQGAHKINQLIFSCLTRLLKNYTIIHQTGSSTVTNDFQTARELAKTNSNYTVFDFDSVKGINALIQADIVISRAGAHTVYELAVLQKKCILIPIPWVSHHEQSKNALLLVENHQAIILPESDLTPANLIQSLAKVRNLTPNPILVPQDGLVRLVDLIEHSFL